MKSSTTSSSSGAERTGRRSTRGAWAALLVVVLLGGCSTVAERTPMEAGPAQAKAAQPLGDTVQVQVSGGAAGGGSERAIRNDDFKAAVETSLLRAGLFKTAAAGTAAYTLAATLVEIRQPPMGLTMTSSVEVGWSLVREADKAVLFRRSLDTSHTLGVSDAIGGATRVRKTLEGAARKNIETMLQELARLPR